LQIRLKSVKASGLRSPAFYHGYQNFITIVTRIPHWFLP